MSASEEEIKKAMYGLVALNISPRMILKYGTEYTLELCKQVEINRRYKKLARKILERDD